MLEGCKKKKDEFIKQSVVNLRRRNDEIAHTHRDIVLRELGKDKVKKITNIDNIPDRCEVYYNKYQALNVSNNGFGDLVYVDLRNTQNQVLTHNFHNHPVRQDCYYLLAADEKLRNRKVK